MTLPYLTRTAYYALRESCRAAQAARGLSNEELAIALNVSVSYIRTTMAPNGSRRPGMLERIADYFGVEHPA